MLYKTVVTFDSVSEISKCYRHWCESCHLNSRWWILSSVSPEEIHVMSKIHEIPLLLYFLFIYLFYTCLPANAKLVNVQKFYFTARHFRLCSHYTGLLLRMHENHTGYGFCSQRNGDFGAISVTKRSCAASIFKVESHISNRCSYHT